jgi:hypothetical protein
MRRVLLALVLAPVACASPDRDMNAIAESYVKLALAVGVHDSDYVDAYYGPPEWRTGAEAARAPLETLHGRADVLLERLAQARPLDDVDRQLRREYLERQLLSLRARVRMLTGTTYPFNLESRLLYDAVAPALTEGHFAGLLAELDTMLPGAGPVSQRLEAYRARFVVPGERLDTVFQAAIAECRARTARQVALPPEERFTVAYVTDKPWSGYNWYQGDYASRIEVNTDLPVSVDRALDLACHEGYPGHHVYNTLLEHELVRGRGWMEFTVHPLFSPRSLIAEGSANYGLDLAFPGDERTAFERDVLFPLAGLPPEEAERHGTIRRIAGQLGYAGNEAARGYLDGRMTAEEAEDWLIRYALMSPERAEQRLRFIERYRSYVINYNLGRDLVAAYVERLAGGDQERRWQVFAALLGSPRLPSGLGARQE